MMEIKLSACTIAKNEAENIKKSIESYKKFVDEIIVVDTGSVDDTIKVAEEAGAKVLKFEWIDDFAAAKNYAIDNSTGDWIIFLDADEWFDGDSAKNIKKAIGETVKNKFSSVACKLVNFSTETEVMEVGTVTRIFKKDKNIKYERPIHEILFDEKANEPLPGLFSYDLTINHSGYMCDILKKKAERNKKFLDKTYALGKALPIDYFYCLRENININPDLSNYFFKLIENTPDYEEKISKYNIASAVDENKIKLVNKFPNEYSFEKRLEILKKAQESQEGNPIFKYYEYALFINTDKKRAIQALKEAVELSKDFEKKHPDKINSFYAKSGDVFAVLGEYEILINDKVKALDYFSQSIRAEVCNQKAFWGIISLIGKEKNEDIIIFLNSLYDKNNKDALKFLVGMLRFTSLHEVFLYFFVEYNKKYDEVDCSFFTSRLITGNFDEITDVYTKIFNESKDIQAMTFISAALIAGNMKEKYSQNSGIILPAYSKILNAYFNEYKLDNISEGEYVIFRNIFNEIAFIAEGSTLEKLLDTLDNYKERAYFDTIKYYFESYDYEKTCEWIRIALRKNINSEDFKAYINYVLTNVYFRTGDFEKLESSLGEVISRGYLSQDIIILCEILEADDEKLENYYDLYNDLAEVKRVGVLDKIEDVKSDGIKFITLEAFKSEIKNKPIGLITEQIAEFFNFADKAFKDKAYAYAEKFYKIAIKYGYNKDICYYSLGYIYNYFNKPDLSFYCYEQAFTENFLLAKKLLPESHPNYNYVYSKKEENYTLKCPICGEEGKPFATYVNIEDEGLSYNQPVIVEYMMCDKCHHIFAKNDNKGKNFWYNEEENSSNIDDCRIEGAYECLEDVGRQVKGNKILILSKDSGEIGAAAENLNYEIGTAQDGYDVIFAGDILEKVGDIKREIRNIKEKLRKDSVAVFNVFDFENAFSKLKDRPLWAGSGKTNVFSRQSLNKIFSQFDLEIAKISVSKSEKGRIIVFVRRIDIL